ncbi:MAG: DUF4304 domain-containing protein [Sulfuritalea sp.]|nr:DUF4304 domain-containing protein [Sulfuritalea sp.]
MKAHGFRKSGPTWHRDCDRMIQVLNIQKSQWGDQFYINLGIYLKDLGSEVRPTEYRCHVRCRVEQLLDGEDFSNFNRLLNFDELAPLASRYKELRSLVAQSALAWLDTNSTKDALAITLKRGGTKGFFIMVGVAECLGIETFPK